MQSVLSLVESARSAITDGNKEALQSIIASITPAQRRESKTLKLLCACMNEGQIDQQSGDFDQFEAIMANHPDLTPAFGDLDVLKNYARQAISRRAQILHVRALLCYKRMLEQGRREQFKPIFDIVPGVQTLWHHQIVNGHYDVSSDMHLDVHW